MYEQNFANISPWDDVRFRAIVLSDVYLLLALVVLAGIWFL